MSSGSKTKHQRQPLQRASPHPSKIPWVTSEYLDGKEIIYLLSSLPPLSEGQHGFRIRFNYLSLSNYGAKVPQCIGKPLGQEVIMPTGSGGVRV